MGVLVDPRTGERYENVPDDQVGHAQSEYGLVTPDEYAKQKERDEHPIAELGTMAAQAVARGAMAPGMALTKAITGKLPGQTPQSELPPEQQSPLQESVFGPEALARKDLHPYLAGALEQVPTMLGGVVTAGAGLAPLGAAGTLGVDSALQGISQEAVDAVTRNQDFSWKSAGWLGLTNLALGGALHVGLGALGRAAAGGVRAGAEAAAEGAAPAAGEAAAGTGAPPGMRRNYLAEVDPGELPEAVGAARKGKLQSVGAAAAGDDLPAAQAATEVANGTVDATRLAESAPAIRDHLSLETEKSFNVVEDIVQNDATIQAKHADFRQGAAEWTPEMVERQNEWLGNITHQGAEVIDAIDRLPDTRGIGHAGKEIIEDGLKKLTGIEDAERNVAIDNLKRKADAFVIRLGRMGNQAVDEETRAAIGHQMAQFAHELRGGLENPEMFGRNAHLQQAQNAAYTDLIDKLKHVQKRVFEVEGQNYDKFGQQAIRRRADPDKILGLFTDPRTGGELFKRDLGQALDAAERLGRARADYGMTGLERIPELIDHLQKIRDDFNTSQVLTIAQARAALESGEHGASHFMGGPGTNAQGTAAAYAAIHIAEAAGRAIGVPIGVFARTWMRPAARALSKVLGGAAEEIPLAAEGTATRSLLDRFAERVRGAESLGDPMRQTAMPDDLRKFLDESHARPLGEPATSAAAPPGAPPSIPPAPPANDIAGKVAGGLALAGGAGALLAPGQANAATLGPDGQTMLPEQAAARAALADKLSRQSPEERQASIETAEALARIGDRTKQRVDRAVGDLFTVAVDPTAPQKFRSPAARAVDQRSADLDVPRAVARFMGNKTDDPVQAWQEKRELINRVMADPSSLAQTMAQNLGDLPHKEPEIFTKMVAQTMKTVSYLADKMPAPTGKSAVDPGGYPPSFEDITTIAGYWVGALHPLDTLDDLAQNDLVPEQIQAVKDLNPDAYQMFQSSAMRQIHAIAQAGKTVPLDALQQIDSALQLDGAGEPVLSSKMAALIQTATQQAAQKGAPVNPPSPLQGQGTPIQSKAPARLASSSLGTLHDAQG